VDSKRQSLFEPNHALVLPLNNPTLTLYSIIIILKRKNVLFFRKEKNHFKKKN